MSRLTILMEDGRGRELLEVMLSDAGINPGKPTFVYCEEAEGERWLQDDCRFVLLCGNVPLHRYRPDLRVGKARGRLFMRRPWQQVDDRPLEEEPVMLATFNPEAVRRNGGHRGKVEEDLALLLKAGRAPAGSWGDLVVRTCVVCEEPSSQLDDQSIAYCGEHLNEPD